MLRAIVLLYEARNGRAQTALKARAIPLKITAKMTRAGIDARVQLTMKLTIVENGMRMSVITTS